MAETIVKETKEAVTEEKVTEKKEKRRHRFSLKKFFFAAGGACLIMVAVMAVFSLFPYAIYVDGEEVCRVGSLEDASDAITTAVGSMAAADTRIKIVKSDKDIEVVRVNTISSEDVLTVADASECIGESLMAGGEGSDSGNITIISTTIGEKAFTPEPEYVQDTSMAAGHSRVIEEGKDGVGKYLFTFTTVNGVEEKTGEELMEVIEEGKSEVIAKGTKGLPPGEDWRTYEGDPIFSDGAALVATAKQYIGAPYKWGGTNLQTGVSCIGFVKAIYAKYGVKIPMSHPLLKKFGVGVSYSNAQPGDIICYKEHTGIYIGNGKMIDAASNRGVGISRVRPGMIVTVRRVPRS